MLTEVKEEERKELEESRRSAIPSQNEQPLSSPPPRSCACFGTERRAKRRRMGKLQICDLMTTYSDIDKDYGLIDYLSILAAKRVSANLVEKSGEFDERDCQIDTRLQSIGILLFSP